MDYDHPQEPKPNSYRVFVPYGGRTGRTRRRTVTKQNRSTDSRAVRRSFVIETFAADEYIRPYALDSSDPVRSPIDKSVEGQISSRVADDQRIPGVVFFSVSAFESFRLDPYRMIINESYHGRDAVSLRGSRVATGLSSKLQETSYSSEL